MVVDGLLVSVGSTNFDNRSFRLNDEATLNIIDAAFAARQTEIFEEDLGRSRRVSFAEWRERPLREQLVERFASLDGSQLWAATVLKPGRFSGTGCHLTRRHGNHGRHLVAKGPPLPVKVIHEQLRLQGKNTCTVQHCGN